MAFVLDSNDPSNLGMFSKAGRFTSEKHLIFQKKDEILNNQRKFLKVTSLPHLKMDLEGKDPAKSLHDEDEEKLKVTPSSKIRPHIEPFSVQVSREEFYEGKKVRHPPPPCGFYNPKFHYIDKGPRTLFKYDKEKARPKTQQSMVHFNIEEVSRPIPDKVKLRVVGPTPLHKQKGRDELKSAKSAGNNPHESRFTFFEFPQNCGRSKKVHTVDMKKMKGRGEFNLLYKSLEYSPDYEPNFEFGKKRLGSPGPRFEKMSSRKPFLHISTSTNENFFDISKTEVLKYSRPKTVNFDKYTSREFDPKSPLPSFMQKSVNSRVALGSIRQKTLEINNFSDGKFQTIYSSFSPTKTIKSVL